MTSASTQRKMESYECHWKIPNWVAIQKRQELVERQKILIETGSPLDFQSTWEVGLMLHPLENKIVHFWKLVKVDGDQNELEATIKFQLLNPTESFSLWSNFEMQMKFRVNEQISILDHCLMRFNSKTAGGAKYLDVNGAITFLPSITIKLPNTLASSAWPGSQCIPGGCSNPFLNQILTNLSNILKDSSSSDLKIVTSDGKELLAHKLIVKAQCPVFASMFASQFSENSTGVVNVEDISGKTMEILILFLYTGELLSTWSDEDTVVEFTYAAGKYQMIQILQMLDDVLGTTETCDSVPIQLLNLAHKLSLKNAEKRLLKSAKRMTVNIDRAEEFLALFKNTVINSSQ